MVDDGVTRKRVKAGEVLNIVCNVGAVAELEELEMTSG